MSLKIHEIYKPFIAPDNSIQCLLGEVLDGHMGGAYFAPLYIWIKGNPLQEIHPRCGGFPVWSKDSVSVYFTIWSNSKEGFLQMQLAQYHILQQKLIIYEDTFAYIELKTIDDQLITVTQNVFEIPADKIFRISELNIQEVKNLPLLYHADYYNYQSPFLNNNKAVYNVNPNPHLFAQYVLHCYVKNENDRIFYNKQLLQLYELLWPLMKGWKFKRIFTDTALFKPLLQYKYEDPETVRVTGVNAPNGGRRNIFNLENVQKVSTLHIVNNPNLIAQFEGTLFGRNEYKHFPKGLPTIFSMELYGRKNGLKIPSQWMDYNSPMHFHLRCENNLAFTKKDNPNQLIAVEIPLNLMPAGEMDALIKAIGKICFAEKNYKNESAFFGTMYIDERDYMTVTYASRIAYCKEIEENNKYGRKWELL
jgi:hypothetical protein